MTDDFPSTDTPQPRRKPRIALMGEFSAGKSTLTNLLIGDTRIPMRVTATQLPPVWLSYGTEAPYRVDLEGRHYPIDGDSIDGIPVRDTAFIRLFAEAEVLEVADIIDTPGISDPNMPAEVWQRAAEEADGVIWLTHATQAWRQSEAAVWSEMPEDLWPNSLLLVTRIDKILSDSDRARVLARVRREAGPMFREVLPISLIQALAAGEDDAALWQSSGGEAFSQALLHLITDLERAIRLDRTARPNLRRAPPPPMPEPEPVVRHHPPEPAMPRPPAEPLRVHAATEPAPEPQPQAAPAPAPAPAPEPLRLQPAATAAALATATATARAMAEEADEDPQEPAAPRLRVVASGEPRPPAPVAIPRRVRRQHGPGMRPMRPQA